MPTKVSPAARFVTVTGGVVVPGAAELKPTRVPVLVNPTKGTVGNGVGVVVGVNVAVEVAVALAVGVFVFVLVGVLVAVDVKVPVAVAVLVNVAVGVFVAVGVTDGLPVGVLPPTVTLPFVRDATGTPSLNTNPAWG